MDVGLNGFSSKVLFFFFFFKMVLTVIHLDFSLMLIPKKCALKVNLSLCVSLCACMHRTVYIRGCECVFLCFNVCCFYCFLLHTMM